MYQFYFFITLFLRKTVHTMYIFTHTLSHTHSSFNESHSDHWLSSVEILNSITFQCFPFGYSDPPPGIILALLENSCRRPTAANNTKQAWAFTQPLKQKKCIMTQKVRWLNAENANSVNSFQHFNFLLYFGCKKTFCKFITPKSLLWHKGQVAIFN